MRRPYLTLLRHHCHINPIGLVPAEMALFVCLLIVCLPLKLLKSMILNKNQNSCTCASAELDFKVTFLGGTPEWLSLLHV